MSDTAPAVWRPYHLSKIEKCGEKLLKFILKKIFYRAIDKESTKNIHQNFTNPVIPAADNSLDKLAECSYHPPISKLNGLIAYKEKVEATIHTLVDSFEQKKNIFKINGAELYSVMANKKVLGHILKSIFSYINEKNSGQEINIQLFEDSDYTLMVAEHNGTPLSHLDLRSLYQKPVSQIKDSAESILYSCLHILKLCGGWLTAGKKNMNTNYITLGIPNNKKI